jgi:hypothetical protein
MWSVCAVTSATMKNRNNDSISSDLDNAVESTASKSEQVEYLQGYDDLLQVV